MKINIKLAALAISTIGLTIACNQKTEKVEDTIIEDTIIVEDTIDSIIEEVAEEVAPVESVKPAATKKTQKKAETAQPQVKVADNTTIQVSTETAAKNKMSKVAARNAGISVSDNSTSTKTSTEEQTKNKMAKVANRQ